jgi:hypothetical protein
MAILSSLRHRIMQQVVHFPDVVGQAQCHSAGSRQETAVSSDVAGDRASAHTGDATSGADTVAAAG